MVEKRTPRTQRVRTSSFRLMPRDREILRAVHQYRLLSSEHIAALIGGSAQNLRRRLKHLYNYSYLDRPRIQFIEAADRPGSDAMVYALGNRGAELIAEEDGRTAAAVDWTTKNRALKTRFFRHALMVAGIVVGFEVACREAGNVCMMRWGEILRTVCPERTRALRRPKTWRVRVEGAGEIGVTPDGIFGLHYLDKPEGRNRGYFFLEADRSTMPVTRTRITSTAIYKKLLAYNATALQGFHTQRFGFKNFRVLFVTESPEGRRVKTMVKAAQDLGAPPGQFLFASSQELEREGALACRWVGAGGEVVMLG